MSPQKGSQASEQTLLLLIQHTPKQSKCCGDESDGIDLARNRWRLTTLPDALPTR